MQPEYLTNSFRFTSQDSKILLTYYVMGLAFGCVICPNMFDWVEKSHLVSWIAFVIAGAGLGAMLVGINVDEPSMVITCIC